MADNKNFNTLFNDEESETNGEIKKPYTGYSPEASSSGSDLKKWSFSSDDAKEQTGNESIKSPKPAILSIFLKKTEANYYRSESLSLLKIDGVVVSKSSSMTDFTISVLEKNSQYTAVNITVINTHIDNNIEGLNNFNNLLKKIASVKNNIIFKVNNFGTIAGILNKDELREKWLRVRSELEADEKFRSFKPEDQKQILKGGDDEYLQDFDIVSFINKGHTFYTMIFCGYWKDYELQETYDLKPQYKTSTLFRDKEIPLEINSMVKRYSTETDTCQLEVQGIESHHFDNSELKSLYKKTYPFAKKEFEDYSYDYNATFELETGKGLLKRTGMTVIEQAGSILMFMDCNIKKMNDEESNIAQ